jgi:hypothetical protein
VASKREKARAKTLVTLVNTFHNTAAQCYIPAGRDPVEWEVYVSEAVRRRVWRALCPHSDCKCQGMVHIS